MILVGNSTEQNLKEQIKKRFDDAILPVRDVLKEAKLTKDDIDEVILIGGSTRIPKVQQLLQEEFDGKKIVY